MENVIPIAQLPAFIDEAIAKVNEGVWLARKRGLLAEMPKEVQVEVVVVKEWQALEIVGTESSVGTETNESNDSGSSTRTSTSTGESADNSQGTRRSAENSTQRNFTNEG